MYGSVAHRAFCCYVTQVLWNIKSGSTGFCTEDALLPLFVKNPVKQEATVVAATGVQYFETCRLQCRLVITQNFQGRTFFWPTIQRPGYLTFQRDLFLWHALALCILHDWTQGFATGLHTMAIQV